MAEAAKNLNPDDRLVGMRKSQIEDVKLLASESPENVLEKAQEIGLITKSVRQKIDKVLPGSATILAKVLEAKQRDLKAPKDYKNVFAEAFFAVYGRFLFEAGSEKSLESGDEKKDSKFKNALKKILKIKGTSLSPELEVAMSRLSSLVPEKKARDFAKNKRETLSQESELREAEFKRADESFNGIERVKNDVYGFSKNVDLSTLDGAFGEFEALKAEKEALVKDKRELDDLKLAFQNSDIGPYLTLSQELLEALDQLYEENNEEKLDFALEDLMADFNNYFYSLHNGGDTESWEKFLDKLDAKISLFRDDYPHFSFQIGELADLSHDLRLNLNDVDSHFELQERIQMTEIEEIDEELRADFNNLKQELLKVLSDWKTALQSLNIPEYQAQIHKIGDAIANAELEILGKELSDIGDLKNLFVSIENEVQDLSSVIDIEYQKRSGEKLKAAEGRNTAKAKLDDMPEDNDETALGEDAQAEVFKTAFKGMNFEGDKIAIHGFESHFPYVVKRIDAANEYFDSPTEVQNLRAAHSSLQNLVMQYQSPEIQNLIKDLKLDPKMNLRALAPRVQQVLKSYEYREPRRPMDPATWNPMEMTKAINAKRQELKKPELSLPVAKGLITKDYNTQLKKYEAEIANHNKIVGKVSQLNETLKDLMAQSEVFYKELSKLMGNLELVEKTGIKVANLDDALKQFKAIDLRKSDFDPQSLMGVYGGISALVQEDSELGNLVDELKEVKADIIENTKGNPSKAAKKILSAVFKVKYPDLTDGECDQLATADLMESMEIMEKPVSAESIEREISAKDLEIVKIIAIKEKALDNFAPFKGANLSVDDFTQNSKIDARFESYGSKPQEDDLKREFYILAWILELDGDTVSLQAQHLARKLKAAMAMCKDMSDKMTDSRYRGVLDNSFKAILGKSRQNVKAFSSNYDEQYGKIKTDNVDRFKLKHEQLKKRLEAGEIDEVSYNHLKNRLLAEIRELKIESEVDIPQEEVVSETFLDTFEKMIQEKGTGLGEKIMDRSVGEATGFGKFMLESLLHGTKAAVTRPTARVGKTLYNRATDVAMLPVLLAGKPLSGLKWLFTGKSLYSIRETYRKKWDGHRQWVDQRRESNKGRVKNALSSFWEDKKKTADEKTKQMKDDREKTKKEAEDKLKATAKLELETVNEKFGKIPTSKYEQFVLPVDPFGAALRQMEDEVRKIDESDNKKQ